MVDERIWKLFLQFREEKSVQLRREREIIENILNFWEEKEKGIFTQASQEMRGEREVFLQILKIERRAKNENSLLQLERENYE